MSQGFAQGRIVATTTDSELTAFGERRVAQLTPIAGWTFAYNLIDELVTKTLVASGAVSVSAGRCKLESGAATSSSAKIETRRSLRYMPGIGAMGRFTTVYATPAAGNQQTHGFDGAEDGLYFGYNGTTFGVCRKRATAETWVAQSAWNGDTFSWLNPQFGNVYQITYQWLGYGAIRFWIADPVSGKFILVHTIRYTNTTVDVSLLNPNLPIAMKTVNTTNNTNIIMYSPSAMAFQEHRGLGVPDDPLDVSRSLHTSKDNVKTEAPLMLIRNATMLNSITNRITMRFGQANFLTDGTKTGHIRVIRNPTLGGTAPVYTDILANQSPAQYDITLTGVTYSAGTGIEMVHATLTKVDRFTEDLSQWNCRILPGDTLLVTGMSASDTDLDISLQWLCGF